MNEQSLPDELARLEAALERRSRPAPSTALRLQALANVRSARALERRLLAGTVAAVLLFALVLGSSRRGLESEGLRSLESEARLRSEGAILERLDFDTPESQSAAIALLAASVPCIAPAVGSNESMSALLRGL